MIPAGHNDDVMNISADLSFIHRVQREITAGGSLPFNVPTTRIPELVRRAALKFYKEYHGASEERWIYVPSEYVNNHIVMLSKHIISVYEVRAVGSGTFGGIGNVIKPSVLLQNFASVSEFINGRTSSRGLSFNKSTCDVTVDQHGESAVFASLWYASAMEQAFNSKYYVQFFWNHNTSRLRYDNYDGDAALKVLYGIELEYLYEDDLFLKYVTGLCLSDLEYILGAFDFKLPGGVTINYEKYKERGEKLIEEVETEFDESDENDIFIIT